jgi:diguanylate cyclase (GGDEF)-like protein
VINGLLASYVFFGIDAPLVDLAFRVVTYFALFFVVFGYVRPTYLKMANRLDKGWWILNCAMILSYGLMYFILFVPDAIFHRPIYFIHGYIAMGLTVLIYLIMSYLFQEIDNKMKSIQDKEQLSAQVSSLHSMTASISSIAYTDTLTSVKNRYSLYKDMDQMIKQGKPFLLVFMDLDQLKEINDRYSHQAGDRYLKSFADACVNSISDYGEVYRFAGDEFIGIIKNHIEQFDLNCFRLQIEANLGNEIPFLGISCGLSYYPTDGLTVDDLISLADQLMYLEKKEKKQVRY